VTSRLIPNVPWAPERGAESNLSDRSSWACESPSWTLEGVSEERALERCELESSEEDSGEVGARGSERAESSGEV